MDLRPYLQFNRNLSSRMTAVLARTPLTPNGVTTLGLLCGLCAGWAMSAGTRWALIAGAALLHLAFLLDNCDGELARIRGRATPAGRRYDMSADVAVDFALWIGLGLGAAAREPSGPWIWIGAAAAAGSLINFAMVAYERSHGCSASVHIRRQSAPEIRNSTFHSIIETLCHNGDVIVLVWLAALAGSPGFFLAAGSVYIHTIWIARCSRYFPKLPRMMLRATGVAAGFYVLWLSTREVTWAELLRMIGGAGPAVLLSFLIFPIGSLFHATAFFCLLRKETRGALPFWRVYRISLFGDAVNKITPFVDVGGEPLKIAMLARKGISPAPAALRAAWNTRILFVFSEAVYLVPAVLLLAFFFPSRHFILIGGLGIVFSLIFTGILLYLKKKTIGKGAPTDSNGRREIAAAFIWHVAGWVVFTAEVWVILQALGMPPGILRAFLAQALLQAITSVSFFVPGNIGAQEGGLALLLRHMGFSPETGIALSLFKRARQVVWAAAGFAYYAMSRKRSPERALSESLV